MVAFQRANWKEEAIERSEAITDAWEVTKTYAGRLAEWVLFVCMVANIIEILPGVQMWGWLVNTVLGVQAVTLDVAGFGLATMAEQARLAGKTDVARRAKRTAYVLIGLMMVTVLSISIGTLWPSVKGYTDIADKILILIRVGMTVWYGHVLHELRQHTGTVLPVSVIEERLSLLTERVSQMQPKEVNYRQLAQQIVPLLPQPERVNSDWIVESVLTELSQLQAQKEQAVAAALSALQAQMKTFTESLNEGRRGSVQESEPPVQEPIRLKVVKGSSEKQAFIREYLSEYQDASISDIVKAAKVKGLTLSQGYVSEQRKLFLEQENAS